MTQIKRFHFFSPNEHINDAIQTDFSAEKNENETIIQKMRNFDTKTLLQGEYLPSTAISRSFIKGYSSLGLYCTAMYDERFDQLSRPKGLYSDLHPGIICNLYETEFSISVSKEETFTYETDERCLSFIKSLETGKLTPESLKYIIKKNHDCKHWINGCLICKVIDHRQENPSPIYIKLEISSDVFNTHDFKINFDTERAKLEFERKELLFMKPIICVDPSPDIARIQSAADHRRKMWQNSESQAVASRIQHQQHSTNRLTPKEKALGAINDNLRKAEAAAIPHFTQFRTKIDIIPSLEQKIEAVVGPH